MICCLRKKFKKSKDKLTYDNLTKKKYVCNLSVGQMAVSILFKKEFSFYRSLSNLLFSPVSIISKNGITINLFAQAKMYTYASIFTFFFHPHTNKFYVCISSCSSITLILVQATSCFQVYFNRLQLF